MADIRQVLGRMVLVNKAEPDPCEGHRGVLISRLEIGLPLVVLLGGVRRLTTTRIREVHSREDGSVEVRTANSSYIVRFLHPEAGRSFLAAPARKRAGQSRKSQPRCH